MTKLNRLKSLKSQLQNQQKSFDNIDRRARTRTLIQMGGLLNMIGLPQLCGINDGDDLQLDLNHQDKAATLLGMLVNINESLFSSQNIEVDNAKLEEFKQRGVQMLKDHATQKSR